MRMCQIVSDNSTMTTFAGSEKLENTKWLQFYSLSELITMMLKEYSPKTELICLSPLFRLLDLKPEFSILTREGESLLLWPSTRPLQMEKFQYDRTQISVFFS